MILTGAAVVQSAAHYGLIDINITVPDLQVVAAIRVGTNPRFVVNIRPLAAKIRQGYQISGLTSLTLWKTSLFHGGPPPNLKFILTLILP
ncbi:MAG: hypothetical protein A2158_06270 [Chloroflexi bacterium RBG_13_46_14]|nr:MAG: hypothetical protein A2158_06270 [Chloroflexi bacterium RBG_13_46_14]